MNKLAIVFGYILLLTTPAFSMSLNFDFDGDPNTWETEWTLSTIGETVQVDIWLDVDVPPDPDCYIEVFYSFLYDKDLLEVDAVWANDDTPGVGGPWDSTLTSIDKVEDGEYNLGVGNLIGVFVGDKILLHSLVLRCIGRGEGDVEISGDIYDCDYELYTKNASAAIKGPCAIIIDPESADVDPEETIAFNAAPYGTCVEPSEYTWGVTGGCGSNINAAGLYTAGDVSVNCTDTVTATDTANENIQAAATVNIEVIPVSTTTTTSTSPTIPIGSLCITDKSCNDWIYCNGEERCDYYGGQETGVYSWSTGLAGSTGNTGIKVCQRGEVPCPDDGLYCTGEISCDEEKKICLSAGDPCEPEGLVCDEESNICRECVDDEDCDDDGLFCNGDEICVDGSCGHSGDPCPEGTTCVEETRLCVTTSVPIEITASPDPMMRSRWVMLPTLVVISGENTSFSQLTSRVSYSPSTALLPMPALVLGPEIIWQLVFVNPSWLAGFPGDPQTVTATVDDAEYELKIELLPFILDQK